MKPRLVIWGSSGHAQVVVDIVRSVGMYGIHGFVDDTGTPGNALNEAAVQLLGGRECLSGLVAEGITDMVVAVGDCRSRLELATFAEDLGYSFPPQLHPASVVARSAHVGDGTVVVAGAVVNPGAWLGKHVIVNTSSSIDHGCVVQDGAHISPGAHLAGWVTVGETTWIGIGAVVKDRVRIGSGAVIGAGSVVLDDIPDKVVAVGCPAQVIKRIGD